MSQLEIVRHLDAEPAVVWQALTDGRALAAWYWPPSWPVTAQFDARPGGAWRIASASPELAAGGVVVALVDRRSARLTWRWDGEDAATEVELDVRSEDRPPTGGGTVLTVRHSGFRDEQTRLDHIAGWASCLDRLPDHLARQRG